MKENSSIMGIKESIRLAMELPKCRKCGCMKETLETMNNELSKSKNDDDSELLHEVENSIEKMEPIKST